MRTEFLPFAPVPVDEAEAEAAAAVVRSGWLTTGAKVDAFEDAFARWLGVRQAVALSSCTAALHTALVASGIGEGDEVITTPLTFAATVNEIEHAGARPIVVDVEPDTLNLAPSAVEAGIGGQTAALLPVHYAGHPAELDDLGTLASDHGLHLIEDAAHALGASYRGRAIGSGNATAAFSFYATKNLAIGEGGMLTGPAPLLEEARLLSLHGMDRDAWRRQGAAGSWAYEITRRGFKYNMTDIQAAIGLVQLDKLDGFQLHRKAIAARYLAAFADQDALELPVERPHVDHAWQLFVLRLHPEVLSIGRDRFIEEMAALNVATSVHFIPIHLHPYYRDRYGYAPDDFPVALDSYRRMLSIPLTPALSDADVDDVIEAVLEVCATFRR